MANHRGLGDKGGWRSLLCKECRTQPTPWHWAQALGTGAPWIGSAIGHACVQACGLTIHSSRTYFVPATHGRRSLSCVYLHYAFRLNSGVRRHTMHPLLLCPHCNRPCLGFWSKISLGPARRKPCSSCGNLVSVPWLQSSIHLLAIGLIPLFTCLFAITLFDPLSSGWLTLTMALVGLVAGSALEAWLYYRFVPLVASVA